MFREIRQRFGKKKIGAVTPTDIMQLYREVEARASVSTANRFLTFVRSIFNKAIEWRLFYGENPCARIKKKREPPHKLRYLDKDEMKRLLTVTHPRLRPVIACALLTGMRRTEILDLTWDNVDLTGGIIHILRSKSGKGETVPILPALRKVFESLVPKPYGSVFDLPFMSFRRYFDRARKESGIAKFVFHDLRRTCGSQLAMNGTDIYAIQKILRHSTPVMTMIYAQLSPKHLMGQMMPLEDAIPIETIDTLMTPSPISLTDLMRVNVVKST